MEQELPGQFVSVYALHPPYVVVDAIVQGELPTVVQFAGHAFTEPLPLVISPLSHTGTDIVPGGPAGPRGPVAPAIAFMVMSSCGGML